MSNENVQISKKNKLDKNKEKNDVFAINSHVDENKSAVNKSNFICHDFVFEKSNYVSIIIKLNDEIEINIVNQKFIIINNIFALQKPLSKSY